jgi:hypothetical protein
MATDAAPGGEQRRRRGGRETPRGDGGGRRKEACRRRRSCSHRHGASPVRDARSLALLFSSSPRYPLGAEPPGGQANRERTYAMDVSVDGAD